MRQLPCRLSKHNALPTRTPRWITYYLITLLLRKIKDEKKITDKINNIINSINCDCMQTTDNHINNLVNINQVIEDLISIYPDLIFEKELNNYIEFIGSKIDFREVLINIVKNSQEAGATNVKFKTKKSTLIITDSGECTKAVIDKLNNENIFTTKEDGNGIGTQVIRQFCKKQDCILTYSSSVYTVPILSCSRFPSSTTSRLTSLHHFYPKTQAYLSSIFHFPKKENLIAIDSFLLTDKSIKNTPYWKRYLQNEYTNNY